MKLPGYNSVFISKVKLTDYVLSETHTTGKSKAKFFRKLGFFETNVGLFEKALRKLIKSEEVKDEIVSEYGIKYIVDGKINTPIGKTVRIRTIWIIENGQKRPRFVTVYPL